MTPEEISAIAEALNEHQSSNGKAPATGRAVGGVAGGAIAVIVAMNLWNTQVVAPRMMNEVRVIVMEAIERHDQKPHRGAVSDTEFKQEMRALRADLREMIKDGR